MAKKIGAHSYVSLAPNNEGRDFTISVVDGGIFKKLKNEGFNKLTDRLIYNGEIMSASARPCTALCTLLNEDYFYAVRDQATASFLAICTDHGMYDYEGATDRGFNWVVNEGYSSCSELSELATRLRKLPTIIDIQTPQGLVGFVPGIVPPDMTWADFAEKIEIRDRWALNAVYYSREAESIKGIDKICISSRHATGVNGNVISVGDELTEISSWFKVVSILSKTESAIMPVPPSKLSTYEDHTFPAAAVA